MLIELNLDERVISKIKEILESEEYENEKEVIVRAIDNLYERTKSELEVSPDGGGDEAAASQDSGVGGRIRKVARRIRGEKEDGGRTSLPDSSAAKAQPKRTRKKV